MSEMIENVAAAIRVKLVELGIGLNNIDVAPSIARAAIEAMRTPTEAMVDEATIDGCPPRLVWSIMIDSALSKKP